MAPNVGQSSFMFFQLFQKIMLVIPSDRRAMVSGLLLMPVWLLLRAGSLGPHGPVARGQVIVSGHNLVVTSVDECIRRVDYRQFCR